MKPSDFIPVRGVWMYPFWLGSFVFGLMLLIGDYLPSPVRRWTLPSLAVYLVGLGSVIFLKELFHRRHIAKVRAEEGVPANQNLPAAKKNLPTWKIWVFLVLELLLLGALVWYNAWRGVL